MPEFAELKVDGKTYDKYRKLAKDFVNEMKKFIEKKN